MPPRQRPRLLEVPIRTFCRRFNAEVVAPALGVDSLIVREAELASLPPHSSRDCWVGHSASQIQRIPTFRCHLSGTGVMGLVHCDADYGHQPSEINFWMPLCNVG